MKEVILNFLSALEGYHQRLKEIHFSTLNKSEHLLVDDMDGDVLEYQDRIAEVSMGCLNTRFGIGDLKTLVPSAKNTEDLVKELLGDIESLIAKLSDSKKYNGIINVLDDFTESVNKWNYLRTLK